MAIYSFFFFFQAEDGIRDKLVTGVQTCALPISIPSWRARGRVWACGVLVPRAERLTRSRPTRHGRRIVSSRSEEHTSELQSLAYLVCRLLLEKKKKT